ncbi:MAG: VOC family protein [Actinomycetes bacterium]
MLMVDTEGEEAATFYTSVFKNSSIRDVSRHGEAGPCGWLKDKYGVSWQVIPTALNELLSDPDPEKSQRAMKAMLAMSKIDIEALKRAAEQEAGAGQRYSFRPSRPCGLVHAS